MKSITYPLFLSKKNNGQFYETLLRVTYLSDGITQLDCSFESEDYVARDSFPFFALRSLREQCKDNFQLMLKGSRVDVHPSGFLLGGDNAYILKIGHPARKVDLVHIFDFEPDVLKISTAEEQEKFYKDWLESIRNG